MVEDSDKIESTEEAKFSKFRRHWWVNSGISEFLSGLRISEKTYTAILKTLLAFLLRPEKKLL